ncbi:carbohydrate sulfotransferase 3-like isoform X1 [Pomacea canaliculata]|uniref:carbohydrate sulfotransferase 3-like isoform X1 n=2 Tax=Pomacea canaliculata TaxID=400727 RepID=UPI000D739294|nr:carbohydrate sulfotransferase 3-like isoform X1 [Pomacea canaliculata]
MSSLKRLTIWVKMVRVTMCQVAVATLFLCAAATILYSEHLWLRERSREERSAPVTTFSIPQTCNCTKEVSTAIKQAAAARATIAKNIEGTNNYPTNKRQIIVLSYGRSGSSFTADIVIQDPRTFFVFEPLYRVIIRYTGSDQLHDVSIVGNDKFAPKPNEKGELVNPEPYAIEGSPTYANYSVEATQILRFFLTCQFEYLKADDLLNFMFLNRNNTIEFYKCFRDFPKNEAYFPKYLGCLWKFKELCLSKEIQVAKVIRFPARILRPLMEEFPKLKVLYLVRDPRGTLSSEMTILKTYEKTGIKEAAETFCGMVNDDAENIRLLSESYPDRIRTIRYETIARDAVAAARRMYDFLELSFTPKIEGYIRKITSAKKDGHNFSTSRKDSWAAANKWRTLSSYKNVRAVDSACEDVYDAVGFVKVPRESYLRDINTSLASRESLMENI